MLEILIILVVVCFFLWMINAYIPMPQPVKMAVNCAISIIVFLWILNAFGVIHASGLHWR